MEGLALTRRRCAHALDEPLPVLLLLPDGTECASHLQSPTFRSENRLRIRASLLDRVTLRNCGRDLHLVRQHLVAGKRLQERLNGDTTHDGRLPLMCHGASRLEHGRNGRRILALKKPSVFRKSLRSHRLGRQEHGRRRRTGEQVSSEPKANDFSSLCMSARRLWGLTFDMSGGAKGAKRPLGRPLDGMVRRHHVFSTLCSMRLTTHPANRMTRGENGESKRDVFTALQLRAAFEPATGCAGALLRRGTACATVQSMVRRRAERRCLQAPESSK